MALTHVRLNREVRTLQVMIHMYCREQHLPAGDLCDQCQQLERYALERIDRCPYRSEKLACVKCPVHCYQPDMRARVRQVMRYTGPRMLVYHPLLTLLYYWDQWTHRRIQVI